MFKKLLCPTDFSEPSSRALQWAESCARKFGSELVIVHVLPFPDPNFVAGSNLEEYQASASTSLNKFVSGVKAKHEVVLSSGEPWQKIVELSQTFQTTGIVIGTRGLQGVAHKLFGSTAENVMRESTLPVITVSNLCAVSGQNEKKKVLLPISSLGDSIPSRSVIKEVIRELKTTVTLMHVVDFNDPMFARLRDERPFQVIDTETALRKKQLSDRAQDLLTLSGTIQVNPSVVRFGDATEEILNEVRTECYDLLFMPVRKRTLLFRFKESVAYRVLSHSNIPVIAMKGNS